MKRGDWVAHALVGISAALTLSAVTPDTVPAPKQQIPSQPFIPPHQSRGHTDMQHFYSSLSPEAKVKFDQLNQRRRQLARQSNQANCAGKNACAGQGACRTSANPCAGKNMCGGKGGAPIRDPNRAVEVQYNQMLQQLHHSRPSPLQNSVPSKK